MHCFLRYNRNIAFKIVFGAVVAAKRDIAETLSKLDFHRKMVVPDAPGSAPE